MNGYSFEVITNPDGTYSVLLHDVPVWRFAPTCKWEDDPRYVIRAFADRLAAVLDVPEVEE